MDLSTPNSKVTSAGKMLNTVYKVSTPIILGTLAYMRNMLNVMIEIEVNYRLLSRRVSFL